MASNCKLCGRYLKKSNEKCPCCVKDKDGQTVIDRVRDMPVINDTGCRELLSALVLTACQDYVAARLKGKEPTKEDKAFITDEIRLRLEFYIGKFQPLIREEEKRTELGTHRTKCPACGGTAIITRTQKLFRVYCTSCVCKYFATIK